MEIIKLLQAVELPVLSVTVLSFGLVVLFEELAKTFKPAAILQHLSVVFFALCWVLSIFILLVLEVFTWTN